MSTPVSWKLSEHTLEIAGPIEDEQVIDVLEGIEPEQRASVQALSILDASRLGNAGLQLLSIFNKVVLVSVSELRCQRVVSYRLDGMGTIGSSQYRRLNSWLWQQLYACPQLGTLQLLRMDAVLLEDEELATIANYGTSLTRLYLWSNPYRDKGPTSAGVVQLSRLTRLKALRLTGLMKVPVSTCIEVAGSIPKLDMLWLTYMKAPSCDADLANLAKRVTTLTDLTLRGGSAMTAQSFVRLFDSPLVSRLTALQVLDLKLGRSSDWKVLSMLTALKTLRLRGSDLDDAAVNYVHAELRGLTKLELVDCESVSEHRAEDLMFLRNNCTDKG